MTFIWNISKTTKIRKSHISYCHTTTGVTGDYPCFYVNAKIHKEEFTIAGPFETKEIAQEWINKNFK